MHSGIRIASLEALEEFEKDLSSFQFAFDEDCVDIKKMIQSELAEAEYLADQAYQNLQSERDYVNSLDEPDENDWFRLGVAEEKFDKCSNYRSTFSEFAEIASSKIDGLKVNQEIVWAGAARFLTDAIDSAKNYYAISLNAPSEGVVRYGSNTSNISFTKNETGPERHSLAHIRDASSLPLLPNGLSWVRTDELDWEGIPEALSFKKAAEADIGAMLSVFDQDVLPHLRTDDRNVLDRLIKLDHLDGRSEATNSRAFAYEFMVGFNKGSDVISLDRSNGASGRRYTWLSGRHRSHVAKAMGWQYIPARIVGE